MSHLHPATRILSSVAALAMIAGYFLPLWEIQLWAPQYPEGLNMKIWLDHLGGDFEIINGLNHYIGMRHIKQEMFPEFLYMKYALGFLIAAGLVPALTGKRAALVAFVAILFLGAGLGLYDFWRWGYDYGHNLDPKAAISVPGMTYQPPIIGYKSLLNFVAYSGPDKGGWILVASGAIATALLLWETLKARRLAAVSRAASLAVPLLAALLILPSCQPATVALQHGKDECAGCKMLLADKHYGSAFVTDKGKVFKFDDLNCLLKHIEENRQTPGKALVVNFSKDGELLPVENAVFLKHPKLRTPMNSGLAAFATADAAQAVDRELGGGGKILNWAKASSTATVACNCES